MTTPDPAASPLTLCTHPAQALGRPDLIALGDDTLALRFETMKILSARAAVQALLADGTLRPGDRVIDSSSGIYAIALALACHEFGLRCRIIGSTTIEETMRAQLELLGVELECMPPSQSLRLDQDRRVARVREILADDPSTHWMQQYHDPVHRLGYLPVGRAVVEASGARRVTLVAPVGSGVSSEALAAGMREAGATVRLVGVQPFGSLTFGSDHVADPEMIIAGIGSAIPFGNVRHDAYDRVHWIGSGVARSGAVDLLRRTGLFAGLSSGAGWAALGAERERVGVTDATDATRETFLLLVPDTGHRYVHDVHARHAEWRPLAEWRPREITDVAELALPWCASDRVPCPPAARAGLPGDAARLDPLGASR